MVSNLIFLGTSEFAVPSLRALAQDSRFHIKAIITQPDRPVGRHATMTPPAIKTTALELGITTVLQPEKLNADSFRSELEALGSDCDAFVVIAYGKILPIWMLALPKHGVVNVHGSLLPKWRGPSPIHAAIANGDEKSGVTIMKIDERMDHGPILSLHEEVIRPDDTTGSLHDRLAQLGAENLPEVLSGYLDGMVEPKEQDHDKATVCKILTRDDGKIDWNKSAREIERLVRASYPWPGTWTELRGERVKILEVAHDSIPSDKEVGTWFSQENKLFIACGDKKALEIKVIQIAGKKATSDAAFLTSLAGSSV